MYIGFLCETDEVRRAAHIWRQRIAAFEAAPPEEAAIAALELEAAERRYMLALRQAGTTCAAAPSRNKGESVAKVKVKSKEKSNDRRADQRSTRERAEEHRQTQRNATKNIAKE